MRQKRKWEDQTKRLAAARPGCRKWCRREPQIKKATFIFWTEGHELQSLNRLRPQMKKKWALIRVQHCEILESRDHERRGKLEESWPSWQNNMEGGKKPQGLVTSSFQPRELRSHFAHWGRRWSTGYFLQIQDQIRRVEAGSSPISRAACFVDILFSFLEHLIFGKISAYLANRCYQEYVYSCHSFSQLPAGSKCWAV